MHLIHMGKCHSCVQDIITAVSIKSIRHHRSAETSGAYEAWREGVSVCWTITGRPFRRDRQRGWHKKNNKKKLETLLFKLHRHFTGVVQFCNSVQSFNFNHYIRHCSAPPFRQYAQYKLYFHDYDHVGWVKYKKCLFIFARSVCHAQQLCSTQKKCPRWFY